MHYELFNLSAGERGVIDYLHALLLYHRPSVAVLLMYLLKSQTRHHGTDVLIVQILAKGGIAADSLQYLGAVAESYAARIGGAVGNLVETENLLLGIVGDHEQAVVLAHQFYVVACEPIGPERLCALGVSRHLLA